MVGRGCSRSTKLYQLNTFISFPDHGAAHEVAHAPPHDLAYHSSSNGQPDYCAAHYESNAAPLKAANDLTNRQPHNLFPSDAVADPFSFCIPNPSALGVADPDALGTDSNDANVVCARLKH